MRTKLLLAYAAMVIVIASVMAVGLYVRISQNEREALHERLTDIVRFSAPLVDGDFHALIRVPEDVDSSFYKIVALRLNSIRDTSEIIARIYTLRQNEDGSWAYVVGVDSINGAEIGDLYLKESDLLVQGNNQWSEPRVEDEIFTDQYGTYLSGYAPIYDQFNQLDGVLGIDIDASSVIANEKKARSIALIAFITTVPLSLLLGWWIFTSLTLPVKDLVDGAARVANGELSEPVPVRSYDELGVLATTFNAMTLQLRQTLGGLEHEITEHKRVELVQNAIYRISQAITSSANMHDLYFSIHQILSELMPVENFYIALYDPSANLIHFPYSCDENDKDLSSIDVGHGLTAFVLRTGQPALVNPEVFDRLQQQGEVDLVGTPCVEWLGAPLKIGDQMIGVMATQVYTDKVRFTEEDVELFEFVSTQVAQAIDRKRAETELQASNERYQNLFEESPISLWEEDFSEVKIALDDLRKQGVTDFKWYLSEHLDFVKECSYKVKVLDVNKATLSMYGAKTKIELMKNLTHIFNDESYIYFREELCNIAAGLTKFDWEGVNLTLDGKRMDVSINWSVVPGYGDDLSRVIISVIDITERKQVETQIRYMGTHDVMTGLFNRAHFDSEMSRVEEEGIYPISIIVVDMDYLKHTNDSIGHAGGDELLRQAGRILKTSFRDEDLVARIGGDEFGVLLPNTDVAAAELAVNRVRENLKNQTPLENGSRVKLSIGASTALNPDELFEVFKQADRNMYADKNKRHNAEG